ncbi:MAG TPA: hypothetical protein VJ302_33925 [Blastocatellia bacterium]|nr:hypothetical protein [Blastocatellia bacterium]
MSEDDVQLGRAYRRAGIGLALGALVWIAALLIGTGLGGGLFDWVIPIASAALSVVCFSRYSKSKAS